VSDKRNLITVRLQGKEKASVQEYSLQKVCTLYVFLDVFLVPLCNFCFCEGQLVLNFHCTFLFFIKDAPLGSILSRYVSGMAASAKRRAKFLFDGSRVTHDQTPADLDMEDGDVIEVWI